MYYFFDAFYYILEILEEYVNSCIIIYPFYILMYAFSWLFSQHKAIDVLIIAGI